VVPISSGTRFWRRSEHCSVPSRKLHKHTMFV